MTYKKRKLLSGILHHCYQRTVNGYVLFYNVSDCLVFFTNFCVVARRHNVRILSLCLMPDHIHFAVRAGNPAEISAFVAEYTRLFSLEQNHVCHRKGALFESPFGSAPKVGDKKARTNLIYIGNNPVERRLCKRAEEYRWNFIAYAECQYPYSSPVVIRRAGVAMKAAIKEIKYCCQSDKPLTYTQLRRLFGTLSLAEKQQLTDFVITQYNVIDHAGAARFFDSYGNMLSALHSNTGSEYDLNEIFVGRDDTFYSRMSAVIMSRMNVADIHDILGLGPREMNEVYQLLICETSAPPEQIVKYLRLRIAPR